MKTLSYWRRIGIDHIYVEYKDDDHTPEPNPLDNGRLHSNRYFSEVIRVYQFEMRHLQVDPGDENGQNYQQTSDIHTPTGKVFEEKLDN